MPIEKSARIPRVSGFMRLLFVPDDSCVIPFFSDVYLKADTAGNWSQSGSERIIGKEASQVAQNSMDVNFPMMPIWTRAQNDPSPLEGITNSFFLINESDDDLLNNFKFLNAFVSGNFWVQMNLIQQSPNVFDVEIPGRYHSYFSALGIEVKWAGKIRVRSNMKDKLAGFQGAIRSLQFPDAYQVSVKVTDLCPNNFNTYLDYLKPTKTVT